ncbi:MAG TPA: transglycosylase SLT domain-containing protein, partial [Candidatus Saccharimonadales bacterium]|nr:transglycosylase SLT domain-containing protein [Candidatus Saccharimonadales bacterium]
MIERDPWAEALAESASLQVSPPRSAGYPDYPVELNAQVLRFLNRFTGSRRDVVEMWLTRSGRYLDMIQETFEGHGLPTDLAFTAMIESGFNPLAVSRAGAKGLWQFMAQTARRYGLRVDRWVDERLDPDKSTRAAAAYFRDLYTQFGSWTLAQAAYNAGEVAIARAIRKTGSSDFWVLNRTKYLRRETQDFVPAIQAATIIGRNPERYGFDAAEASPRDHEQVKVPPKTDLRHLARASGLSFTTLRSLNPVLVRGVTPPGDSWELKVPAGAGDNIAAALAKRHRAAPKGGVHVVRARETVSSIAKHYGVSISDVLRWNSLTARALIHPGDRLRIAE